jgi:hypothetical protein
MGWSPSHHWCPYWQAPYEQVREVRRQPNPTSHNPTLRTYTRGKGMKYEAYNLVYLALTGDQRYQECLPCGVQYRYDVRNLR